MFSASIGPDAELRLLEERHAATVFARINQDRAYLREWLPWVDSTLTEEDVTIFIRSELEKFADHNGFAAGLWTGGRFAGVIGTHKIQWMNRRVELGYWLGQEFQGKGLMTCACQALIKYEFCELDLNRVEIHCAAGNAKSAAIPKRLGFQFEGVIREGELVNGKYLDLHLFGLLKRDWREQASA